VKWPEEERREDDYHCQYQQAAKTTIGRYQSAHWRRAAVTSTRKLVEENLKKAKSTSNLPCPPDNEQLCAWLQAEDRRDAVNALRQDDKNNGRSMGGALLAEAAGALFCTHPTVSCWQMVGQIIGEDLAARKVLVELVKHRMSKRPSLRENILKVARKIVQPVERDPGESSYRNDHAAIAEMHRRWKANPDLHEIWFGLHALGHIMPFRRDWYIFDLLLELDTAFAAELIEAYEEPYQPAMILGFGTLTPSRRFSDWGQLMEAALPAFDANGAWNGRVLLPLLLLAAQDAMRSRLGSRGTKEDMAECNGASLADLTKAVASALWKRPDGGAAALRWGGWLFRSMMVALDGDRVSFPGDADSRARPDWLIVQTLMRSSNSTACLDLRPTDVAPEDELCLEAVRILAAGEHDCAVPGRALLLWMLPDKAEDFLGREGKRRRDLPSLFVTWGKRADAFGTRVLASALFDHDVATTFADMWHRTLTLREIVEHGDAFRSDDNAYDDYARDASKTLRFVIALGINLIDYVQDVHQTVTFEDRHATMLSLFSTLHDATREMLAIDPIGRQDMENIHDHLCVRRFLYEETQMRDRAFAAPLADMDQPTAGDLLYERCETSREFFGTLRMLLINGISRERIERALESVGVRLDHLIEQAKRLNVIEHERGIDLTGLDTATLSSWEGA
jgi:hypothetical protein